MRTFIAAIPAVVILALAAAACQPSAQPAPVTPASTLHPPPTATPTPTAGPTPRVFGRTLSSGRGSPLSDYLLPPQSVQDLVNRYEVAFTGTITAVGDTVAEKPYDWDPELEAHFESRGLPPLRHRVTYYEIQLDEVFLDDGNLVANPRLRLSGDHNPQRPQVGERFLFVLGANPDGKSYGINADWNVLHLDAVRVRNFDGKSPGYEGVTGEASLIAAVRLAAANRVPLPRDQWPIQDKWKD